MARPRDSNSSRRRPRRSSPISNNMGAIVGIGVSVIALVTVIAIFNKKNDDDANAKSTDPAPTQEGQRQQPAEPPPRKETTDAKPPGGDDNPDRPAPKLTGKILIAADTLCKRARVLYSRALRAQEDGDSDGHNELIEQSRVKFEETRAYLELHTKWLEDAKQKDWPIPSTYKTLEKKLARYRKHEALLPPK